LSLPLWSFYSREETEKDTNDQWVTKITSGRNGCTNKMWDDVTENNYPWKWTETEFWKKLLRNHCDGINQRNRTEDSEITPHNYRYLTADNGVKKYTGKANPAE
jgi:hypothetical protein